MVGEDERDPALVPTIAVTPRDDTTRKSDADLPQPPLAIGERLGDRYVVKEFLGQGGMGAVYRAADETLGEDIALKLVHGTGIHDTLREEVRLAQKVTHANVCRTYDLEEAGGHHFVKMEYVAGETLAAKIAREGKLAIADAVRIALAIADGLAAAHAKGIVHRDLKPGNVMLSHDRTVLMDFGVACLIAGPLDGLAGTLGYMAPEQLTEGPVDGRADLYALGCVLFEMLAGEPLYGNAKRLDLAIRHVSAPPRDVRTVRPEAPRWLALAIRELLAKQPERREHGIARLRAGAPSRWKVVAPLGLAAAVLATLAIVHFTAKPPWHPELVSYQPYEEVGSSTSLSPDGQWLVLDSDRAEHGVFRIYVMPRGGGDPIQLATPAGLGVSAPRWLRDGKAIVYEATVAGGDHIYRQAIAGSPPALAGPPIDLGLGIDPDACGDDAIVYLDSSPLTKHVMVLGGDGSRRELVSLANNESIAPMHCDPSGQHVVFVHGHAPLPENGNDVFVVGLDGTVHQLTQDHAASSAVFTSDGRSIVFTASRAGKRDVFVMPATGGAARPLGLEGAGMVEDVSRDGRVLVFDREDSSVFPVIAENHEPRMITSRRGLYVWPRPAGNDRVVVRRADGASSEVITLRIADGAITPLAPGYVGFPSLDNTRVYFRKVDAPNVLMSVPIDGGAPAAVATLPGTIMHGTDGPDGVHVAVEMQAGVLEAYVVAGGRVAREDAAGIVSVAPSGGWRAVTELFTKSGDAAKSRLRLVAPGSPLSATSKELEVSSVYNLWLDDHRIGYCDDAQCHVLDVATGAVTDLAVFPKFYAHGAIVMPDGKHVVDLYQVTRITRHALVNFDSF